LGSLGTNIFDVFDYLLPNMLFKGVGVPNKEIGLFYYFVYFLANMLFEADETSKNGFG
jgi:hypothetical protein